MNLSSEQISAQLDRVLLSDPGAIAVAIRSAARQSWPESLNRHGRTFALRWCESSLAIREALCDIDQRENDTSGLVVLTPLATHEVAEDIAARLARARIFQPEAWELVRQLFDAKDTDARLGRYPWMPQMLIEGSSQGSYPPVASGFLDLDTAWGEILHRFLHVSTPRPDAVALLQWSLSPAADYSLKHWSAEARTDAIRWLGESAGDVGALILGCVEAGRTADALALGLVCGVIYHPDGSGETALGQAAIRLERFVNDKHVGVAAGRAWARAAEQEVRAAGLDQRGAVLDRADALLRDIRIAEFAQLSDFLPSSLEQRLKEFAQALTLHVAGPDSTRLARVERLADRVKGHVLIGTQPPRLERVEMARRLARWLLSDNAVPASLQAAATWQTDQGAYVDWARFRLLGGDELLELSDAYRVCREAVIVRRNDFDQVFARLLSRANDQPLQLVGRLLPVESVLERVLAPLASTHPVLLLVMDGLSTSIFRELFARIATHGWAEMVQMGELPLVGLAALPTVTEVSRASLLCGRLTFGVAAQEKAGFASHPALLCHSRADKPPRLFHKGDLADATNLASDVREAVADPQQRVVGVVYNAVDDHLSGPDQLHQRWALEDLRLLLPLLREARETRRVVVLTADHGHLLEDGTTRLDGADSDRWRPGGDSHVPHELAVSGGRVVTVDGVNAIVCLWGESTRYKGRKNGYHGGISPQEATVPLSVFVPLGMSLAGWDAAPPAQPEWWDLPPLALAAPTAPVVHAPAVIASQSGSRRQAAAAPGQTSLFADVEAPPTQFPVAADWLEVLLSSPLYTSQRQLAARVAPPDDTMRCLLTALTDRGGKLSRAALAQRLAMPEVRLGGLLSAVRRILNADQSAVLTVDETAGTIELNRALLNQQFRLGTQDQAR